MIPQPAPAAPRIMLIAGETSGDTLAAELAVSLRQQAPAPLDLFGAGGPRMAAAGVDLAFDMTAHAVVGFIEIAKHYPAFRRLFDQLLDLAFQRRPDVIVCVDFSGFNRRFAHAVRQRARRETPEWRPRIVQYVSPQVWASRPGRAAKMARDIDLLLVIFPFEKAWYASRLPDLPVLFPGHPMLDRHADFPPLSSPLDCPDAPEIILLPGSRAGELKRHLPLLLETLRLLQAARPGLSARLVLSDARLAALAAQFDPPPDLRIQTGGLAEALSTAALALACTGTVTMECAYFGVPSVTFYKTSWITCQIARLLIQVSTLTMPNLLAKDPVYPEFIQDDATPGNLARAGLDLLNNPARRRQTRATLQSMLASLGGPGASHRAASAVLDLLKPARP